MRESLDARARSRSPGRPRRADVEDRLGAAVLSLIRSGGPTSVTVESVAAASGVAKTTIYRRYANRDALLADVLTRAIGTPAPLPTGSAHDKLRLALEQGWRQMGDVLGPGGLAAILLDEDPEFTELFRALLRPYDDVLIAELRADARAGLLRSDLDAEGVVTLLDGAYLGELVRHGRVDPGWLDRCLDMVWNALAP